MKKTFLLSFCSLLICLLSLPKDSFSQNIGIGTNTPTRAKLEVHGAVDATNAIFGGESSGVSLQRNRPGIGFNEYWNGGSRHIANGYAAVQYFDPNTGTMYFDMFPNGSANTLTTAGTRALSISNNGNMAIKTNPANASLYAIKAGNFDGSAVFGGTSYNSHFHHGVDEHTYIRGGKNGSNVYLNDIPGNLVLGGGSAMVGINSGNPTYTLEIVQVNEKGLLLVDPNVNFNFIFSNWEYRVNHYLTPPASHLRLYYNGAGTGAFYPTGGYAGTVSDRRIKTNIRALPSVLDKIMLLQPSAYEMKNHNEKHEKTFGFIAQDVRPLFPELVSVNHITVDSVNRIPDLHGLNYTGFSVIAIKALQEQYQQIQALQKENDELMMRLEALEKKIVAKTSINR